MALHLFWSRREVHPSTSRDVALTAATMDDDVDFDPDAYGDVEDDGIDAPESTEAVAVAPEVEDVVVEALDGRREAFGRLKTCATR